MRKTAAWILLVIMAQAGTPELLQACCGDMFGPPTLGTVMAALNDLEYFFGGSGTGQSTACANCALQKCENCPPRSFSPVFLRSGNYQYAQTDLVLLGRGPLIAVQRVYNSHDTYVGPVGVENAHVKLTPFRSRGIDPPHHGGE